MPANFPLLPSRRQALCRLGAGFGAIGLASAWVDAFGAPATVNPLAPKAPHFPPRAKRLIFLFMNGGPSHVDTFDPKPMLTKNAGKPLPDSILRDTGRRKGGGALASPFQAKKYGQSGIEVTELYPEVGGVIDEICVLRSMWTDNPNHEPGLLMMNSGNMQPIRPSMGSWLTFGLGSDNQNLPGYIVLCPGKPVVGPQLWSNSFLPGIYQGTQIDNRKVDPKTIIQDVANRYLPPGDQRRQLDLLQEMNRLHAEQRQGDDQLEARIQSLEMAFRMQTEAQEAFDINKETQATRQRYGAGEFADGCLLARRLVERGVRVVQVYYGNGQPWDDHKDIANHRNHAQKTDKPIAALLKDLKERGLLKDTLVIWGGEFGRTPTSEGSKGRDHHALGFSMWLAGGGVKGGMAYGSTDEFGFAAVENRMHVHDLHATILHLLGLDHEKLTYRYSGRDFRLTDVSGRVVKEIIA
jgi:hypothetical protein